MNLDDIRKKIDRIDSEIIRLLNERAEFAKTIGERKREEGKSFYDPARQRIILKELMEKSTGIFPKEAIKTIYTEIMSTCLSLEQQIKIGYLGPQATFTHLAAMSEFGSAAEFAPYQSIHDIFVAMESGWVDYGVVPIENSSEGVVYYTLDMFIESELKICTEIFLPIEEHLMSTTSFENIKRIYSHPQPFVQCQLWLRKNLPNAEQIEVSSTTEGVRRALEDSDSAAIASKLASEIYDIPILVSRIQDSRKNITRFLVIGTEISKLTGNDKSSILFSVKDKPGALLSCLEPFSKLGINLTKIESRPSRKKAWEYVFFVDLLGHVSEEPVQKALAELEKHCIFVKILGAYPQVNES